MSAVQAPVVPPPAEDGLCCRARLRDAEPDAPDFVCTADAGHPAGTVHAAYEPDGRLCRTWPQDAGFRPPVIGTTDPAASPDDADCGDMGAEVTIDLAAAQVTIDGETVTLASGGISLTLRCATAGQASPLIRALQKARGRLARAEACAAAQARRAEVNETAEPLLLADVADGVAELEVNEAGHPTGNVRRLDMAEADAADPLTPLRRKLRTPPDRSDQVLAELAEASPQTVEADGNEVTGRANVAGHATGRRRCDKCGAEASWPTHAGWCEHRHVGRILASEAVVEARAYLAALDAMWTEVDEAPRRPLSDKLRAVLAEIDRAAGASHG